MEERIATMMREHGEQRETEGYVNGMRTAMTQGPGADVRPLRGVSPRQPARRRSRNATHAVAGTPLPGLCRSVDAKGPDDPLSESQ